MSGTEVRSALAESVELLAARDPAWLASARRDAWARWESLPLPSRVEHLWRYTDPGKLLPDGRALQTPDTRLGELPADFHDGAKGSKVSVKCDALLLDESSRSDTYPTMEVDEDQVAIEHEATVSKVGEEQLFYLQSRGLTEQEATPLIVNGFIEPFTKELPMEYAVELNRLIQLEKEGSVG